MCTDDVPCEEIAKFAMGWAGIRSGRRGYGNKSGSIKAGGEAMELTRGDREMDIRHRADYWARCAALG